VTFIQFIMTFKELQLIQPLLQAIEEENYTQPTPIQEQAIPVVLKGIDLLGCAQTGTGKTAAFAIPMLQMLSDKQGKGIRALILTPTRELAIQIDDSFKTYGRHLRMRTAVVFGGVNQHGQVQKLQRGIDILIATPGRLLDLMGQGYVQYNNLEFFVLDEADRMLDMGFVHDVKRVIAELPTKRQTLFFSATMPNEIVRLANSILTNPIKVEVTPPSTTAETIRQELHFVEFPEKRARLIELIETRKIERALVFTRTKHGANRVAKELHKAGISAEAIHGNKSQNARQEALNNFKKGKTRMLVATDIAARGIDIDELSFVINFEVPNVPETYVHRIGRTGRAGHEGVAISLVDSEERGYIKDIQKLTGLQIPIVGEVPPAIAFIPTEERRAMARASRPPRPPRNGNGPSRSNERSSNNKSERPSKGGNRPERRNQDERRNSPSTGNDSGENGKSRYPKNRRGPGNSERKQEGATTTGRTAPSGNGTAPTSGPKKKKRPNKNYRNKGARRDNNVSSESSTKTESKGSWLSKIGLGNLFKK
jgi:ATP-dependent RNA helicase RhlE